MKHIAILVSLCLLLLAGCSTREQVESQNQSQQAAESIQPTAQSESPVHLSPQIYLYGEMHAQEDIMQKELELWGEHYDGENMRHLFVEFPYYTAELLNLWMQSEGDDILDYIFKDWEGTAADSPEEKAFFQTIKQQYPETVFHGTDVGHQYETTGQRYLDYLEEAGLTDSDAYRLTLEAMEQGAYYYDNDDDAYRENKMAENFIRAYDALAGESVMGIYGSAHTDPEAMDIVTNSVPCMARQLWARYGEIVNTEDLTWLAKEMEPLRVDTITVNDTDYDASYFGRQDITWTEVYVHRDFWRLENAYEDVKDIALNGDVLPYNNYPVGIEPGQVFVIDYTKPDGSVERKYYRSDGTEWEGLPTTVEFEVDGE